MSIIFRLSFESFYSIGGANKAFLSQQPSQLTTRDSTHAILRKCLLSHHLKLFNAIIGQLFWTNLHFQLYQINKPKDSFSSSHFQLCKQNKKGRIKNTDFFAVTLGSGLLSWPQPTLWERGFEFISYLITRTRARSLI